MPDNPEPPLPVQPNPPPPSPLPASESQERSWNMYCHLSALAGFVGIPFGNILGPLLIWQLKKQEIPSVEAHGKAALNFQITVLIAFLVCGAATAIGMFCFIGVFLIPVLVIIGLCGVIFPIIAGIKANEGTEYRYPCTLNIIK